MWFSQIISGVDVSVSVSVSLCFIDWRRQGHHDANIIVWENEYYCFKKKSEIKTKQ